MVAGPGGGWVIAYLVLLALIAAERVSELVRSRRNAAWAVAHGGVEVGQRHFRVMAALHALFLPACAAEVLFLDRPFVPALGLSMLAVAIYAQTLRARAIAALGPRWNVRTIVVPGLPPVETGPYRFVRHPNYVAVVLEGFAIPLVHTAWWTAIVFSVLNAAVLMVRIRCEEALLASQCDTEGRLDALPRFVPRFGTHTRASSRGGR
ncbi:MAG: isoprenylcysteine carboxylmethyltransferase family protein [Gemmatimonadota bacterium]|nr:isoprenylcysteine carboxylmethyltransferase family protein [Gemmatimonadota bacterium]